MLPELFREILYGLADNVNVMKNRVKPHVVREEGWQGQADEIIGACCGDPGVSLAGGAYAGLPLSRSVIARETKGKP